MNPPGMSPSSDNIGASISVYDTHSDHAKSSLKTKLKKCTFSRDVKIQNKSTCLSLGTKCSPLRVHLSEGSSKLAKIKCLGRPGCMDNKNRDRLKSAVAFRGQQRLNHNGNSRLYGIKVSAENSGAKSELHGCDA